MEQKGGRAEHGGIIIRGATGELWFMRDDFDAPRKVEDPDLLKRLSGFLDRQAEQQQFGFPLPDEIMDGVEAAFGPVIGVVHYQASRLNR